MGILMLLTIYLIGVVFSLGFMTGMYLQDNEWKNKNSAAEFLLIALIMSFGWFIMYPVFFATEYKIVKRDD